MNRKLLLLDFRKFYETDFDWIKYYGIYAPTRKMKYPKLFALYCFVVFFLITLMLNSTEYIYIVLKIDNIRNFAGTGYVANICFMATIKAYYLFKGRKALLKIFTELNNEGFQPINEEAKLLAQESLNFYAKVKTVLTIISLIACTASVITPLFYSKKEGIPFAAWYPFNISTAPIHQLVYIHQSMGAYYDTFINIQVDIMVSGLTTFIGVQCDLLSYELTQGSKDSFSYYICYHQRILKFAQQSEKLVSEIYFFQFFATTSGLCMTSFLITLADPNTFEFFFLVVYQAAIFNLLLVPSWFSSELRRKSENLPLAAYSYPWVDAPKSLKKDLIFFIQRTQNPIQFKAVGFFNLSVQVFLKIVQSSFSYYTLLKNLSV